MSTTRLCCPQCLQPTVWEGNQFRPFCSDRCRLLDLGAWADGSYRIPERQPIPADEQDEDIV